MQTQIKAEIKNEYVENLNRRNAEIKRMTTIYSNNGYLRRATTIYIKDKITGKEGFVGKDIILDY